MSSDTIHFFLRYQRRKDVLNAYRLDQAVENFFIQQGYTIDEADLQDAADGFREANNMHTIEAFESWISAIDGYTLEDFEHMLNQQLYRAYLFNHHFKKDSLSKFFENNKWRYAQWDLSMIKLFDVGIAEEIFALLRDEGYPFNELAARFSLDLSSTRMGGRIGPVYGRDLEPSLAIALLDLDMSANPFILHQSADNYYKVYKIENKVSPVFDEVAASFIHTDFLENYFFPADD